ncbi:Late embryoproteinsis abundant protein D-34 [Hibiscus syriacus]|uniref:Late embryoproteinsis abundant protein D-34 n=1 Tax=Hibiscus syriacus TaxID=106335 RepID=A0A6A3CLI4_HIBSY|nr:late embryogenesis abundant protein 47-like [Hibiscus syriacus]KAE8729706.1 Late embryoproteinsis abundant protein D-34 [Hibiscus syriacus]
MVKYNCYKPKTEIICSGSSEDVVGQYYQDVGRSDSQGDVDITIGEALQATALTSGEKPVEWSDAAAIHEAEVRATGRKTIMPDGITAAAQSAATRNARTTRDEDKTKLGEVLSNASTKLASDKGATRGDAESVMSVEKRDDPNFTTHPAGVATSIAAAVRLNRRQRPG